MTYLRMILRIFFLFLALNCAFATDPIGDLQHKAKLGDKKAQVDLLGLYTLLNSTPLEYEQYFKNLYKSKEYKSAALLLSLDHFNRVSNSKENIDAMKKIITFLEKENNQNKDQEVNLSYIVLQCYYNGKESENDIKLFKTIPKGLSFYRFNYAKCLAMNPTQENINNSVDLLNIDEEDFPEIKFYLGSIYYNFGKDDQVKKHGLELMENAFKLGVKNGAVDLCIIFVEDKDFKNIEKAKFYAAVYDNKLNKKVKNVMVDTTSDGRKSLAIDYENDKKSIIIIN